MPVDEFDSRQIDIQDWYDWKTEQRLKAEKQRVLDRAAEAAKRHAEGLPQMITIDDREYLQPIDPLQPGVLVDGVPLNPQARHPEEVVFPGGPSQGSQRAATILGTSVAALEISVPVELMANAPAREEQAKA